MYRFVYRTLGLLVFLFAPACGHVAKMPPDPIGTVVSPRGCDDIYHDRISAAFSHLDLSGDAASVRRRIVAALPLEEARVIAGVRDAVSVARRNSVEVGQIAPLEVQAFRALSTGFREIAVCDKGASQLQMYALANAIYAFVASKRSDADTLLTGDIERQHPEEALGNVLLSLIRLE
ncbi:hypothetical protein [Arenimonas composti]|nr:hypothetical protein [Arenimonas composti]